MIAQGQDVRSLASFLGRPHPWVNAHQKIFPLPASLRAGDHDPRSGLLFGAPILWDLGSHWDKG
jgi:hypothetical protein